MKSKFVKKIMALGLAGVMMLGMNTMVFAADPVTTFDVPITQTIYFKNADAKAVYEPDITYNYTISAGEAGATITDNAGVTVKAKAGDMRAFGVAADGTKTLSINFSPAHAAVTANADGTVALTKKVAVQFDGSAITTDGVITPGVYRYIITQDTTEAMKNAAGIEEIGNQDRTLVLDVTVKNTGEVAGAVIQDPEKRPGDNPNVENKDQGDDNEKTTGFGGDPTDPTDPESSTDPDDPDDQKSKTATADASKMPENYDLYTTYNLTIEKAVDGDMGDKSNKFAFSTAIANTVNNAYYTLTVAGGTDTKTQFTGAAITDTLKHGEKTLIVGLPKVQTATNLTATVTETNNTADTYKVSAQLNDDYVKINGTQTAANTTVDVAADATAVTDALTISNDTASQKVTVTNKLDAISPTGVVLRFAPYVMILAAAIALVGFTRRRRVED